MNAPNPYLHPIGIVGSGISGLSCAQRLSRLGRSVQILDKGRSAGGRMATRMATCSEGELQFDHGAPRFSVRSPSLARTIDTLNHEGAVAPWAARSQGAGGHPRVVGLPRMNALAAQLARELDVHQSVEVARIEGEAGSYVLVTTTGQAFGPFAALALTAPGPQTARLLATVAPDLSAQCQTIEYAPCWVAMLALERPLAAPLDWLEPDSGPLQLLVRDSAKPGRRGAAGECWVVQARHDVSRQQLELSRESILPLLQEAALFEWARLVGQEALPRVIWSRAHRFRYARVERPLGRECLWDPRLRLGVAGDGLLGARVEDAWLSGRALAGAMADSAP